MTVQKKIFKSRSMRFAPEILEGVDRYAEDHHTTSTTVINQFLQKCLIEYGYLEPIKPVPVQTQTEKP